MALGGAIYIVSNHLSEFEEIDEAADSGFGLRAKLAGWINQLPLDNIKAQSLSLTQKLLHRMRIILLKTDNHLMKLISRISKEDKMINNNGLNGKAVDFWRDFSNDNQKVSPKPIPEPEPEVRIDLATQNEAEKKFFDIKPVEKSTRAKKSSK